MNHKPNSPEKSPINYATSGVNIDAGNDAVQLIKDSVKSTHSSRVFNQIGSFAAGFRFDKNEYEDPILVSCTDGVGTKLRIAIETGILDTVGIDLVAMSVNDLICMGAKPLFFLDYVAVHRLVPADMKKIIDGMVVGCKQAGCSLIGGEMAEMNDMYQPGDFDLAGFCVGVVDRPNIIDGTKIKPGHYVYTMPSSGIHSNGFSLVRKVLTPEVCTKHGIDRASLLTPTRIYVNQVLSLVQTKTITGLAHITGGGLAENIERILPDGVRLTIPKSKIPRPDIFSHIQSIGQITEEEMFRVFNMGAGMIVISDTPLETSDDLFFLCQVEAHTSSEKEVCLVD